MEELINECLKNNVKFVFEFVENKNKKNHTGILLSLDKPNCNFGMLETFERFEKEWFYKNIKENGFIKTMELLFDPVFCEMIRYCKEENYVFNK